MPSLKLDVWLEASRRSGAEARAPGSSGLSVGRTSGEQEARRKGVTSQRPRRPGLRAARSVGAREEGGDGDKSFQ